MLPEQSVDLDAVRENATLEGIPLSEIALFYQGLSEDDANALRTAGVLKEFYDGHRALGTFCPDGSVVLSEKVTGAHYLAA